MRPFNFETRRINGGEGDYRMTRDISSESKSPSQSTKHKH